MGIFYENYVRLCASRGESPTAVSKNIGLSNAAPSGWKSGKKPSQVTLEKLAAYFGVTKDELTGEEQKEKPAPQMENGLDAKAQATLNKMKKLSPEQQAAFWDMLNTTIDAVLNMPDGDGNG